MSRIEYLLDINHDMLEGRDFRQSKLNFLELVEQQLADGQTDLALSNLSRQPARCFKIANLHWGQGDLVNAEKYLRMTLERYQRFVAAGEEHGRSLEEYKNFGEAQIKTAAALLDTRLEGPVLTSQVDVGYSPAFENYLLDCCLGTFAFDMSHWQSLEDAWLKNRFPKYKLEEYAVCVKALTGGFASDAEMLAAHEKMWLGKARRNPDAGLMEGYGEYNAYVIDFIFAAVLKRIGWQGTYRHSWPNTCPAGSDAVTTRASDRHLGVITAPPPVPDGESGLIENPQAARRFIDTHVRDQRDWWEGEQVDAARPAQERGKVAKALKEVGWKADPATLDLLRTYRMDAILNDSTHVFLSDPIGDRYCGVKKWTGLFTEEFGMSADFIAVVESEEKADYRDPQGGWYVLWIKDKRVYLVQREDWGDPALATREARPGFSVWPSYSSFVAWWVAQHLEGKR
ncbi:hypothetical protein [Parerythrobacter aestuarii]|uniref:hypothetical protein n=1 Tax=Parerythrobacter aestuarii TaxID=3020909 RepID=UPI0024DE024D|nr:hypothetical protein [Parerythrobacter aestuarii]